MAEEKSAVENNEGNENYTYDGVSFTPHIVAGMTVEKFVQQSKAETFKGQANQIQKLQALHAEATRIHKENTAPKSK